MPEHYNKPALTFEQQLAHLKERGLEVINTKKALSTLSTISYYRLSGYWYPFRYRDDASKVYNHFVPGTSFDKIITLYEFDRRLRLLVMDGIERVEVLIRTSMTYHIGHTYGSFGHMNAAHFHPKFDHAKWVRELDKEASRSSEEFIRHYRLCYTGFPKLPIWMLTEIMSFGALSLLYKGLRNDKKSGVEDKKIISEQFDLHYKNFGDWLHTLTYVRNICAHHCRLWNRELTIRPDKSKNPEWLPPTTPRTDRIFYILLMLRYLLRSSGKGDAWAAEVTALIGPMAKNDRYRKSMGIPKNWKEHPLWK